MTEDQGKFSPSRDSAMPVVEPKTFHRDAYPFIQTVVERVGRRFGIERGITARQILEEVCAYATESFGPLAWLVLSDWGLHRPWMWERLFLS